MSSSDQLFVLIKSLSPHEKGYIRRMASLHQPRDSNRYIRLFDLIDRQEEYDEALIRKKLAGEKLLRNFAGAKHYLLNVILRSLESYAAFPQNEVRSLLNQYNVLREKGLHAIGYKLLRKAFDRCAEMEFDQLKEEVLHLLLAHVITYNPEPAWPGGTDALITAIREISRQNTEAAAMRAELYELRKQAPGMMQLRDEKKAAQFISRAKELRETGAEIFVSFDTRYQYYQLLTNYYYLAGAVKEGLQCADAMCSWLLDNWSFAALRTSAFVTAFYNKALYELMLYMPAFSVSLGLLERIVVKEKLGNVNATVLLRRLQLIEAWEKCRYPQVLLMAADTIRYLKRNKDNVQYVNEEIQCRLIIAAAHFAQSEPAKASRELRQLLLDPREQNLSAIGSAARILLLITEFERGDRITLESTIRSTYRYLLRRRQLHPTEKNILDFLRYAVRHVFDKDEVTEKFKQLRKKIQNASDTNEDVAFRIFDLEAYLDSKTGQVTFAEARERLARRRWGKAFGD